MQQIPRHDSTSLRQFFWLLGTAIVVMFFGVLPWIFGLERSPWPLWIGGTVAALGTLAPRAFYPVYLLWMQIARVLGWINSRLLLGAAFYLMVVPVGLVARRLAKLQYRSRPQTSADSYRIKRERAPDRKDLERPF